jgi:Raf kinase inhibitor-like YbhB/YbcL family protein
MNKRVLLCVSTVLVVSVAGGCGSETPPNATEEQLATTPMPLKLTSDALVEGEPIPAKYTCDGENVSPPLEWSDPPQTTRSFALIVDDPDAAGSAWVHWVLYNIPAEVRFLPESMPSGAELPDGSLHGDNGWGSSAYGGPCPPGGESHRYVFKLYALDVMLDSDSGTNKAALERAMEGHILAQGRMTRRYGRQ